MTCAAFDMYVYIITYVQCIRVYICIRQQMS